MGCSVGFRERVLKVKADDKLSYAEVAARFKIAIASVVRWHNRLEPIRTSFRLPITIDMEALKRDV